MSTDIFKHAYSLIAPEQKKKEWYEGKNNMKLMLLVIIIDSL